MNRRLLLVLMLTVSSTVIDTDAMYDAVNKRDRLGYTRLMRAVHNRNIVLAGELLDARANTESQTKQDGHTALHIAAKIGSTGCTELLIAADANTLARDTQGNTPLILALLASQRDTAECLIRNGHAFALTRANNRGITPLMAAARMGLVEIVMNLTRINAGINAVAQDGGTAFLEAAQNIPASSMHALGKRFNKPLVDAIRWDIAARPPADPRPYVACAGILLRKGAVINPTINQETALKRALRHQAPWAALMAALGVDQSSAE